MKRTLVQTGNSKALIMTREMREHLGVDTAVEVVFRRNSIVIRNPLHQDEEEDRPKAEVGGKASKTSKKARKGD